MLMLCAGIANGEEASKVPLAEDECRAIWNTAAGRAELSADGAKPYIDDFQSVDTNRDRKISNAEFKAGCAAGLVHKFIRGD
jgi:hypothetical protein